MRARAKAINSVYFIHSFKTIYIVEKNKKINKNVVKFEKLFATYNITTDI